jgi:phosphoribosylglycinamide formyltransferase-1
MYDFFVTFVIDYNSNMGRFCMKQIVIFASGSGSNAQQIAEYFSASGIARVIMIYSNRADAYVLQRAKKMNIPAVLFNREDFYENNLVFNQLNNLHPDLIVLAGFLWKVPEKIVRAFPKRIVNIHPALLPKYGGKGMYGHHVHRAVIENREKESGITIHYVNENYDEGALISQATCEVDEHDTPATLAERVHALEYQYYPKTVEQVLLRNYAGIAGNDQPSL